MVAIQQEKVSETVSNWSVPNVLYTLLIRCLREGEDNLIKHYAVKIVECVCLTRKQFSSRLLTNEVTLAIWQSFTFSTSDALKLTCITALSHITKFKQALFLQLLDKVGISTFIELTFGSRLIGKIHQPVITMFTSALASSDSKLAKRIIYDKDFLVKVMKLLDNTSTIIRAKSFLCLSIIGQSNRSALIYCYENRLISYLERDSRNILNKNKSNEETLYLKECLNSIISTISTVVPKILNEVIRSLKEVGQRKHPTVAQSKQIRDSVSILPFLMATGNSAIFRKRLLDDIYVVNVGSLLNVVVDVDRGITNSINAACGKQGNTEFLHCTCDLVENVVRHPALLNRYFSAIVKDVLPPLSFLISSGFVETRVLSLRLFTEISCNYLQNPELDDTQLNKLNIIIGKEINPLLEQLLLESDPLPCHTLRLMHSILESNQKLSNDFIKVIKHYSLISVVFQVFTDHQNNLASSTTQHVIQVIRALVEHRSTNMASLYEHGLVRIVVGCLGDALSSSTTPASTTAHPSTCLQTSDQASVACVLLPMLNVLHGILKYISDVVKKALQIKKSGGTNTLAENAEGLLLRSKPFTELTNHLSLALNHEDQEVAEIALKSLSLLVQLFGGDHSDAINKQNMDCYANALNRSDNKQRKILLRVIKRLLLTDRMHCDMVRHKGSALLKALRNVHDNASCVAELGMSSLASEVLKLISLPNH